MNFDEDPERRLALTYAPEPARSALEALLALDAALATLLRTTSEPAIAQIRLAWWRERLVELDRAPAPAVPALEGLSAHVLPLGIAGSRLVEIVEGWEVLIENERLDPASFASFGEKRGGALFAIGGGLLGGPVMPGAGEGWALADLAAHLTTPAEAEMAQDMGRSRLDEAWRWPRETRALGALASIARMDLALAPGTPPPIGSPRRVARLAWMRLTGR